jgi:transposase-like protein
LTIIETQATSGMSIAAYCREAQVKPSYFYTWRRRLKEQTPCAGGFLELIPGRPIEIASGIRIRLDAKLAIEVERGFDPFTLRAVVETLSNLPRCSA